MAHARAMDWESCRVFLEVARAGSFSSAARTLGISQPTVGRRIAALESALGVRLVVRRAREIVLTADGEALVADVRRMEDALVVAQRRLLAQSTDDAAPVRVSVTEGLGTFLVRELAGTTEPRLSFVVANETVDLSRRVADLAVRLVRPQQPDLIARRVGTLRFGLYASPSYLARRGVPRRASDLAKHELVRWGGTLRPAFDRWVDAHAGDARPGLVVDSLALMREAARAGWGIVAGACVVHDGDPALRRVLPRASLPAMEVWLAAHRDVRRGPRVSRTWALLEQVLRAELGDGA
ncbi:LysR family transcriptional regulator [Sandaracinus amylolyticus]|uniref:LysR family transcriptional regulator n=1 Tax=Sandaracinus amylolyticus TaxID=927083 RepID=UPI0009F830C3|nr:LysR family transcriptional regulator [Sandaracinus amylolyticus]